MAIRTGIPVTVLPGLIFLCGVVCGGCGGGVEETVRGFAGGSDSGQKQEIPSQVSPTTSGAAPAPLTEPAAVGKDGVEVASADAAETEQSDKLRAAQVVYRATNQRDPFVSLVSADGRAGDLVDLSVVELVAVVMGEKDPFCVLEDAEGTSYILRKGDRVKNGRVVGIREEKMTASQTILGYTTTVQLELVDRKDEKHG